MPLSLPENLAEEWRSFLDFVDGCPPRQVTPVVKNLLKSTEDLVLALQFAECALGDIGDAEREPGDDLEWCEKRAASALPKIREVLNRVGAKHSGIGHFLSPDDNP